MTYATDRLLKNARTSLPGALDATILLELYNVLDQFFKESGVWTEKVAFPVKASDPAGTVYYIEPESVSSIVRLNNVVNSQGFGQRAGMALPGEVTLDSPGQEDTFTADVVLTVIDPTKNDGFPEFPEWVLDKYGLGILDGVLGRMMAQPAKPYTNEKLAAVHLRLLRSTISIAATESLHRNVHGAQAWHYPQQFAVHTRRR